MKRPNSSKKSNYLKQKQTLSLMNMINNILLINNSSKNFHISNFYSITNKTKLFLNKQIKNVTSRPISSKKIQQLLQQKNTNQLYTTQISQQRKSLRPKSSIATARQYRASYNLFNNCLPSVNSIDDHFNKSTVPTQQITRNSSYKITFNPKSQHHDKNHIKNISQFPKSIHSTRNFGYVSGYAVNSYKFIQNHNQISQGRIIIISNLTKNTKPDSIISLYCLLQTTKSIQYLDYMREHFHKQLSKKFQQSQNPKITKQLIQQCLNKIQKQYLDKIQKCQIFCTLPITNLGLSLAMVFIKNDQITICTKGTSQIKFSQNFGNLLYGQTSQALLITTLNKKSIQSLDYICLISEGITKRTLGIHEQFQQNDWKNLINSTTLDQISQQSISNKGWFQIQLWKTLITLQNMYTNQVQKQKQYNQYNFHQFIGLSLDALYSVLEKYPSNKNASVLMIGFNNLQSMVNIQTDIFIPFNHLHYIDKQMQNFQEKSIIK